MQSPFTISHEMQQELVDDLEKLSSDTDAHDTPRSIFGASRLRRRSIHNLSSEGDAPGPQDGAEALPEDPINPSHYRRHASGVECIEVTRHMNFNVGNAMKYIWRYEHKGDPVENLKKAQWYLNDEIVRLVRIRDGQ